MNFSRVRELFPISWIFFQIQVFQISKKSMVNGSNSQRTTGRSSVPVERVVVLNGPAQLTMCVSANWRTGELANWRKRHRIEVSQVWPKEVSPPAHRQPWRTHTNHLPRGPTKWQIPPHGPGEDPVKIEIHNSKSATSVDCEGSKLGSILIEKTSSVMRPIFTRVYPLAQPTKGAKHNISTLSLLVLILY